MIKPCVECGNNFEYNTQNQKYCSPQCCRIATNKRIMEKYYAKKARLSGVTKYCDCGERLSRYGSEVVCLRCQNRRREQRTVDAIEAVKNAAVKASKAKSK